MKKIIAALVLVFFISLGTAFSQSKSGFSYHDFAIRNGYFGFVYQEKLTIQSGYCFKVRKEKFQWFIGALLNFKLIIKYFILTRYYVAVLLNL